MTKSFWNKTSFKQLSVWEFIIYRTWPRNPREYTSLQEDILYKSHIIIETIWKDVFSSLILSLSIRRPCFLLCVLSWLSRPETNSKRQATQYGCLPSSLGDGDKRNRNSVRCTGPTRASKAKQKSCVPARQAQRTKPKKDSFHLYSLSPHSPQFQQSAGATTLYIVSLIQLYLS